MMKPLRWLTIAAGALISVGIIWLIARDIDSRQFSRVLMVADGRWIAFSTIVILGTMFTRIKRWAALLHPIDLRGPTLLRALLIGQVLNFVLPLRLGDVARSVIVARSEGVPASGLSVERALGSIALEKAWDWLTLAALALIVAVTVVVPMWYSIALRSIGLVAALVLIGFAVIALAPVGPWVARLDRLIGRLPLADRLRRLFTSFTALRDRSTFGRCAVWSITTWGLGVVANYAGMRAYGVESWSGALVLMVALMIGITLPPSIAALGLFEGVTISALGAVNVPLETALAIGLTLHVVIFAPAVIGAGLLIVLNRR
ncbi:MAG: flippase-like domain-containing protein [Chloroflexi bacterium]|nr:flippase-like domain-containing protein [Chloroflexota bacterium]